MALEGAQMNKKKGQPELDQIPVQVNSQSIGRSSMMICAGISACDFIRRRAPRKRLRQLPQ